MVWIFFCTPAVGAMWLSSCHQIDKFVLGQTIIMAYSRKKNQIIDNRFDCTILGHPLLVLSVSPYLGYPPCDLKPCDLKG